ncbi:MAG: BREX-1 system adenine-specific DNA-methyltransferase PglX [Clostridiales bacterium]|nr:BREX-1 system adenine-specific DNA-methyltransferase PglX [Clostridiales bacterium]
MHCWNADTAGKVRVEYFNKLQYIYKFEIQKMQKTINNTENPEEAAKAAKRKDKLQNELNETKEYDIRLAHITISRLIS